MRRDSALQFWSTSRALPPAATGLWCLVTRLPGNGRLLDHRLQNRDLGREAARHHPGEATVESFEPFRLEEVAPGSGPSLQLDLGSQKMLDLDDPGIEICQVRGSARLAVLEMKTDLEPPSHAVSPDLVVDAVVSVIELEQHGVGAVPKPRKLSGQILPRIGHDRREEISPIEPCPAAQS